ncbi:exosome complex component RRP45 [Sporothrix brasiliensis 5110]|uniref:Exosome complex component RRP45 n=1 Tax=Sporothrix brasiliensis 5110 TaxID=1398154 RepID=A0A0C2F646_9PEZI|nr:exosome complex component RRP45 [Sporothrix brasiliensis 5110]KIH94404.1 exosome complex component RRP45 [Sporothrix brasiliensis 5110]
MPHDLEPSLNEKAFVGQALQDGLRLDGRGFEDYRPISLSLGEEYGVADVRLGNTRIFAKATAEVTVPYSDRPFDGIFNIVTELSPMASPAFEAGRPSETEVLLSRVLEKTLRRSGALDTESLCLSAGQKCWSVRVDVHVLSHDGNLVDASCLAVVAALRHFRKPETSMESGVLTVYTPAEREPVPLSWLHSPFCVTFSYFGEEAEVALLDGTLLEEQTRVGSCTISLNRHGEICQIAKLGGTPVEAVSLLKLTQVALQKAREFSTIVDKALAGDAKRRDKGGLIAELSAENER